MNIKITTTTTPHKRLPTDQLGFGKYFTDHMFTIEYENDEWINPQILPYSPIVLNPAATVLHYGQALFEGMKAFLGQKNQIHLFKPEFHAHRMAKGAERLCMPAVPTDLFVEAVETLVKLEKNWIPEQTGSALYIRPTLIGTESFLGVRPSSKYLFFIICSPVSTYYAEGLDPVKIWIENKSVRAAEGGLGAIKAAANYAASLQAATNARKKSYSQVLWLDAKEHAYIEEVGTMNVFFKINDEVITPILDGTILEGSTRDCVLKILKSWNMKITERKISLAEIQKAYQNGSLKEVFGTGTAAVITPVGELSNDSLQMKINNFQTGELTQKLYTELTSIQHGLKSDPFNWIKAI